jgi:hypothetical protein
MRLDDGHSALAFRGPDAGFEQPRTCPDRSLRQAVARIECVDAMMRAWPR